MKLSVNLNKVALLRNSRGEDFPNLEYLYLLPHFFVYKYLNHLC